MVTASAVAGTAFGPILLALGYGASGTYLRVLRLSLLMPAVVVLLAMVARPPSSVVGVRATVEA